MLVVRQISEGGKQRCSKKKDFDMFAPYHSIFTSCVDEKQSKAVLIQIYGTIFMVYIVLKEPMMVNRRDPTTAALASHWSRHKIQPSATLYSVKRLLVEVDSVNSYVK